MSKYQRTKFNCDDQSNAIYLDQDNILFSRKSNDKRRTGSSKNKFDSNLVDKLAMDSGLSGGNNKKKKSLIGLNSITNPIHNEIDKPLTEIELNYDETNINLDILSNRMNDRLSAHDHLTNLNNNHQQTNQHELSNMKCMLVSLDTTPLGNGSNINRSYQYSTNTLIESNLNNQPEQEQSNNNQPRTLGLMNAVHLNHCSNNSSFNASPNVSFFGLHQTTTIDPTGNTIFGNFGKFKSNARFGTFFRKIKFIWQSATSCERLFSLFIFILLLTICYLSFTVLSLKQLNRNFFEQEAAKRKYFALF